MKITRQFRKRLSMAIDKEPQGITGAAAKMGAPSQVIRRVVNGQVAHVKSVTEERLMKYLANQESDKEQAMPKPAPKPKANGESRSNGLKNMELPPLTVDAMCRLLARAVREDVSPNEIIRNILEEHV